MERSRAVCYLFGSQRHGCVWAVFRSPNKCDSCVLRSGWRRCSLETSPAEVLTPQTEAAAPSAQTHKKTLQIEAFLGQIRISRRTSTSEPRHTEDEDAQLPLNLGFISCSGSRRGAPRRFSTARTPGPAGCWNLLCWSRRSEDVLKSSPRTSAADEA